MTMSTCTFFLSCNGRSAEAKKGCRKRNILYIGVIWLHPPLPTACVGRLPREKKVSEIGRKVDNAAVITWEGWSKDDSKTAKGGAPPLPRRPVMKI
jgi:hypothetical protein